MMFMTRKPFPIRFVSSWWLLPSLWLLLSLWLLAGCDTQTPAEDPGETPDPDPAANECEDLRFTAPGGETDAALTGKILFSSRRTGRWQLYTMKPDGSEQRQLTFFRDHFADTGRWSPDGARIVFTSDSLGSTAGTPLYLMEADGSDIRPLKVLRVIDDDPLLQPGNFPTWSPDGNRIAFTHCLNCEGGGANQEIMMYDFAKDDVINITSNIYIDEKSSWSPSGDRIVFVSGRDAKNSSNYFKELYIMDVETGIQDRLTFERAIANMPIWSPNGEWIAFALDGRLRLFHLDCNAIVPINVVVPNELLPTPVAWSPDGSKLLVVSSELGLYLVDVAREEITPLLEGDEVFFADWSRP